MTEKEVKEKGRSEMVEKVGVGKKRRKKGEQKEEEK